jgi:methylase of polypeptide subunit release factors
LYIPSEDSYFIGSKIERYKGKNALEIGTGSGLLLEILSKNFETVIGTDIHLGSLIYSSERSSKKIMMVCCDVVSALRNIEFDLIVSNPPYLNSVTLNPDVAVCGGISGIEVPIRFINSSINLLSYTGKFVILLSDSADFRKFFAFLYSKNLSFTQIGSKKLFFEKLYVVEIRKKIESLAIRENNNKRGLINT